MCEAHLLIVRHLPNWFPGTQFKRDAAKWDKLVEDMYEMPFAHVKRNMVQSLVTILIYEYTVADLHVQAEGKLVPSLTTSLLSDLDASKDNSKLEELIKYVVGTVYVGACNLNSRRSRRLTCTLLQLVQIQ